MSCVSVRRRAACACAIAIAAAVVFSGSAIAADEPPTGGCPVVATVQPFGAWQDFADYFLAPDGDIERGASSWDLAGGATAVEGNQPFDVGAGGGRLSLSLPARSTAMTPPVCIGVEHRTMRFFARGSGAGVLKVHAIYAKDSVKEKRVQLGTIRGSGKWAPSPALPMKVNEIAPDYANALPVVLQFSAVGRDAWQIDDLYIDPYRRG